MQQPINSRSIDCDVGNEDVGNDGTVCGQSSVAMDCTDGDDGELNKKIQNIEDEDYSQSDDEMEKRNEKCYVVDGPDTQTRMDISFNVRNIYIYILLLK